MLTEDDLKALLISGESDRVERTTSINDNDKFSRAVCAFANDLPNHGKPGYLLIGVTDDGSAQAKFSFEPDSVLVQLERRPS